jgi:hypothetical protein
MFRQSSGVRSTTTAASCSLFALPHSFRAAAVTDEQLVYGRSALLARVFAPAASRRFLDAFTAQRTCFLVVSHGFGEFERNADFTPTDEALSVVSMDDSENRPDEKSERCHTKRDEIVS